MAYVTSFERLAKEEGREEGIQKGRQEGREQGREEGRNQGVYIGEILSHQKLLGMAKTDERELADLSIEELTKRAGELEVRVRGLLKGN